MKRWGRLGSLAFTLLSGAALATGGASAGMGGPPQEVEEIDEMEFQEPIPGDLEEVEVEEVEQPDTYQQDTLGTMDEEVKVDEQKAGDLEEIETEEVTVVKSEEKGGLNRGPYVLLGAGVDGFTGGLHEDVNAGVAWGANAGVSGSRLGFELGYSGSANQVDGTLGDVGSGADIVRNSGQAAVTLNLTTTALHPYVLGGIGIERYTVRNGQALGFENDTSGYVPAAAGLRWNIGKVLTADARVTYNFMFDDEFAPGDVGGNRLQGMLTLGGTY